MKLFRHLGAPAVLLAAGLAAPPGPAAAQTPGMRVSSEVHDLYASGGPGIDRDTLLTDYAGTLIAERWRAGSTGYSQGGLAHGRFLWDGNALVAGTSALARSDAGFNGWAQSTLNSSYGIGIRVWGPNDGFAQILFTDMLVLSGCATDEGCLFNMSFLHQTKGRFSYANSSGDRQARFQETLTLTSPLTQPVGSTTPSSSTQRTVGGQVQLNLRNQQADADLSVTGDWSAGNLQPFGPTPASQLGLYPSGDPRNALDDPRGDLSGWNFRHDQVITLPVRFKATEGLGTQGAVQLLGRVRIDLQQTATAGIGPYVYSSSTLSADFADTSTFAFSTLVDPAGRVDFSLARVELNASPVPEPPAAWLALGGAALLWTWRRSARGRRASHDLGQDRSQ